MNTSTEKEKTKPGQESQSISSMKVRRMNSTTKQNKWWIYLILVVIPRSSAAVGTNQASTSTASTYINMYD